MRSSQMISRRRLLQILGGCRMSDAISSMESAASGAAGKDSFVAFEEVSSVASGISWVHVSGQSPEMYLPETVGPGCAFLDYDNDGWMDIYLVNGGPCDFYTPATPLRNALYHNNGDGTFTDVTAKAGVGAPGWGTSAVWFDYDNDGRLDLFVCRFVDFDKTKHHNCGAPGIPALKGLNEYCYPRIYSPMASWLFHNNGDGTFTDVSQKMGIADNP